MLHSAITGAAVRRESWLAATPEAFRNEWLNLGRRRRFERGETLSAAGAEGGRIVGIVSGLVGVHSSTSQTEFRLCHIAGAGTWWGGMALTGRSRTLDIVGHAGGEIILIDYRAAHQLLNQAPEFWRHMADWALEVCTLFQRIGEEMAIGDSTRRVAAVIGRLIDALAMDDPANPPSLPITQRELAEITHLSHAPVGRVMHDLASEGVLAYGYGNLRVRDLPRLVSLAVGR